MKSQQYYTLIQDSLKKRKPFEVEYDQFIQWYQGKFYTAETTTNRPCVNLIATHVALKTPNLLFGKPYVITRPLRPDENTIRAAELCEKVMNNIVSEISFYQEAVRAVVDAQFWFGVLKFGWDIETTPTSAEGQAEFVDKNRPFAVRFSPKDVIWDKDCEPERATWVAFRIKRLYSEVKKDKRYKDVDNIRMPDYKDSESTLPLEDRYAMQYVTLWEIWDKKTNEIIVTTDDGKELMRTGFPLPLDTLPVAFLVLDRVPNGKMPLGDLYSWRTQQQDINTLWQYAIEHIRRFLPQLYVLPRTIEAPEKEKLESGKMGMIVEVNDLNGIQPSPSRSLPPEVLTVISVAQQFIYEISGISGQRRGIAEHTRSATEANIIQTNTEARLEHQRDIVKLFLIRSMSILRKLLQENVTDLRYFPEFNEDIGAWKVIQWDKEAIRGEFQDDIQMDTGELESKELRKKNTLSLWELAGRIPGGVLSPDGTSVNMPELWKEVVKVMGFQNPTRFVNQPRIPPMPEPMPPEGGQGGMPEQPLVNPQMSALLQAMSPLPGRGRPRGTYGPQSPLAGLEAGGIP